MPDQLDAQRDSLMEQMDEMEEAEGPYCMCDLEPTIDESDWGVCDCCGKPLY